MSKTSIIRINNSNSDEKGHSYRIDKTLFYLSLCVLACKVVIGQWPEVATWYTENRNASVASAISTAGVLIVQWIAALLLTKPIIFGALASYFTWQFMYLDSATPGINPPSPLSPVKYRALSGSNYHIGYMFAVVVGPLVSILFASGIV